MIKSIRPDQFKSNSRILKKAIEITKEKEHHSKREDILNFLNGVYHEQMARASKDPKEKLEHVKIAKKHLTDEIILKRLEGLSIVANVESLLRSDAKNDPVKLAEQLKIASQGLEAVGHAKDSRWVTVLQKMHEAGASYSKDIGFASNLLIEAENICNEESLPGGAHKMASLRYMLEAKSQQTPQNALILMEKSLAEIELTEDKHGRTRAQADVAFIKSLTTNDFEEKFTLLMEAGKLYLADNWNELANESFADAYHLKSIDKSLKIEEVAQYQKKSAEAYVKAGKKGMAHNMRGAYYGTLAIKIGLFDRKPKLFLKYNMQAIEEFRLAGNAREYDFFIGNLALVMAKDLPINEKINNLEIATKLLRRTYPTVAEYAAHQLFLAKAIADTDEIKQKDYRRKSLKHLENYIIQIGESYSKEKYPTAIKDWMEKKHLTSILNSQADVYRLKAELAENLKERIDYLGKAKTYLQELFNKIPEQRFFATFNLGMLFIEMEDFDKAISEFDKAEVFDSSNKQVKYARDYANKLLKKGYRQIKEEANLRNEFLAYFQADGSELPNHIQPFLQRVLKKIIKVGQGFEQLPRTYSKQGETELRDNIIRGLNDIFPGDTTSESMVGNGKTDIRVKNPIEPTDQAIGECKLWGGDKAYVDAKDQLFGYLTPKQTYGIIITFSMNKDFNNVYEQAKAIVQAQTDFQENSLLEYESFGSKKFTFVTKHSFYKGGFVYVYHIIFNLYPGN